MGGLGAGNYDAAAETTLTGTVDQEDLMGPTAPMMGGVHLMVSTPAGRTEVHVGPAWYVSSKNVHFAKGDVLTIVGSQGMMAGKAVIIAREITKGNDILTLRDAKGFPLWSGAAGRTR